MTKEELKKGKAQKCAEVVNLLCQDAFESGYQQAVEVTELEMIEKACEAYCNTCDTKECEEFGGEMCAWVKKFRKNLSND